jgi:hypothetical protein
MLICYDDYNNLRVQQVLSCYVAATIKMIWLLRPLSIVTEYI